MRIDIVPTVSVGTIKAFLLVPKLQLGNPYVQATACNG